MLLTILLILVFLILLLLVLGLFVKKEYSIQQSIIIAKPKETVFNYIRFLKNQEQYSKWVMTDPLMKTTLSGTDGTEGFIYAWDSTNKQAGKGEQEIKKITGNDRLDIEVRFEKPFAGVAYTPMTTEALNSHETKFTWGMNGQSKYPMNLMNLFILKMLNKDLAISLGNLKKILEKG